MVLDNKRTIFHFYAFVNFKFPTLFIEMNHIRVPNGYYFNIPFTAGYSNCVPPIKNLILVCSTSIFVAMLKCGYKTVH